MISPRASPDDTSSACATTSGRAFSHQPHARSSQGKAGPCEIPDGTTASRVLSKFFPIDTVNLAAGRRMEFRRRRSRRDETKETRCASAHAKPLYPNLSSLPTSSKPAAARSQTPRRDAPRSIARPPENSICKTASRNFPRNSPLPSAARSRLWQHRGLVGVSLSLVSSRDLWASNLSALQLHNCDYLIFSTNICVSVTRSSQLHRSNTAEFARYRGLVSRTIVATNSCGRNINFFIGVLICRK